MVAASLVVASLVVASLVVASLVAAIRDNMLRIPELKKMTRTAFTAVTLNEWCVSLFLYHLL